MPRIDFYQTSSSLIITVFEKNCQDKSVNIEIENDKISYKIEDLIETIELYEKIDSTKSTFKITKTKIEIKLAKISSLHWPDYKKCVGGSNSNVRPVMVAEESKSEKTDDDALSKNAKNLKIESEEIKNKNTNTDHKHKSQPTQGPYPDSSHVTKYNDWDKYAKVLEKDEESEKPEGDEALQKLFKDIYGKADDATKRAMNKSFQESNGTVLSTNWGEIGGKNTDIQPPDSMEYKKWDQ